MLVLTGEGSRLWEGGIQPLDRVVPTFSPCLPATWRILPEAQVGYLSWCL